MLRYSTKIRLAVLGVFVLAALSAVFNFPQVLSDRLPNWFVKPFNLGLDLQGGTHLVYEADVTNIPTAERSDAIEGVRDVIERRVNSFGVAEPIIQTTQSNDGWRLIVELAGVHDVNEAIEQIGETPLLEFKELNPNPTVELTTEQQTQLDQANAQAQQQALTILTQAQQPDADFAELAKTYSQDSGSAQLGGDLGLQPRGVFVPEFETICFDQLADGQLHPELIKTDFGYHVIKRETSQTIEGQDQVQCRHILLMTQTAADFIGADAEWLYTGLTGNQLRRSTLQFDANTQEPNIALEFNAEGTDLFADITSRNVGQPVAIFLDGAIISSPVVQQPITGGQAVISGQFTIQEARQLAQRLNAGALPVPITLVAQQTVGSSLGQASLQKSLNAGMLGVILVGVFMLLYYRLPGLIAIFALLVYGLLVISIFKLLSVTLTLSGIAGFILSIGMAVDANILIFERIKEELKDQKPLDVALKEGFRRAWPSIYDGNISTLITCFILIGFTTSMVRGFAVTLTIGILTSMFSAMFVTRILLQALLRFKLLRRGWLLGSRTKELV